MAKQAIEGAKRGVLFYVDPLDVNLPGIDYESGPEDPAYNPRNQESLDEGLVESIMRIGVLEPIGVIKRGEREKPVVLYGNQRVRAAREANKRLREAGRPLVSVPCLSPLRGLDDAELGEAAIAENEHRRESSALTKSELAGIQLRRKNGNFGEAAKAFGLGEPQFRALISLKEAAPELKQALQTKRISASAAIEVATLPKEQQSEKLEKIIAAGGTFEIARNIVRQVKGTADRSKPAPSLVRGVITQCKAGHAPCLSAEFLAALEWVMGERQAKTIEGLSGLIKEMQA